MALRTLPQHFVLLSIFMAFFLVGLHSFPHYPHSSVALQDEPTQDHRSQILNGSQKHTIHEKDPLQPHDHARNTNQDRVVPFEDLTSRHPNLTPRAAPTTFEEWICKGRQLLDLTKLPVDGYTQSTWTFPDLDKYGWQYTDASYMLPGFEATGSLPIEPTLQALGIDTGVAPDGKNHVSFWSHEKERTVGDGTGDVTYKPNDAYYQQTLNPTQGLIIAWGVYGPAYQGPRLSPPNPGPYPPFSRLSDITAVVWREGARAAGTDPRNFKYYISPQIVNGRSKDVIRRALTDAGVPTDPPPAWPGHRWTTDADSAAAILASPNGAALAWLLIQHKATLGVKTITAVTVFRDEGATSKNADWAAQQPYVLFEIGAVDIPSGGHAATPEKRTVPVPAGDELWTASIQRGCLLIDLMTAQDQRSAHTDYGALARWGWSIVPADASSDSEDSDGGWGGDFHAEYFRTAFAQAAVVKSPDDLHGVRWLHDRQTRQQDGKTYFASQGEYHNYYDAVGGAIVAYEVYGPGSSGRTTANGLYPDLRQWADVTWLEWQRQVQRAGGRHRPSDLRWIFVSTIISQQTEQLIGRALGSDRELKLWPGDVVDDVGSRDAFRALLGSPNGRGVGWLLAAHKGAQQLGCRVVKSIHVFADGGPAAVLSDIPCMAFEIVDCPADAAAGSAANPPTKRVEERGAGNVRSVVIKLLADIRKYVLRS
ncbi:hypothetical protein LTR50_001315 [Elasticomyces elasticus]|nr:hypothetical protein LTR50_001315 [Elasticomyces elasticus]